MDLLNSFIDAVEGPFARPGMGMGGGAPLSVSQGGQPLLLHTLSRSGGALIPCDIIERDREFVMHLDVPGVPKDALTLTVDDHAARGGVLLHVTAERPGPMFGLKAAAAGKAAHVHDGPAVPGGVAGPGGGGAGQPSSAAPGAAGGGALAPVRLRVLHAETSGGHLHRTIRLPHTVDAASLSATYDNGVLTVVGKKKAEGVAPRHVIPVS
jgi:HSP20 family molecular chaperone IbpA